MALASRLQGPVSEGPKCVTFTEMHACRPLEFTHVRTSSNAEISLAPTASHMHLLYV